MWHGCKFPVWESHYHQSTTWYLKHAETVARRMIMNRSDRLTEVHGRLSRLIRMAKFGLARVKQLVNGIQWIHLVKQWRAKSLIANSKTAGLRGEIVHFGPNELRTAIKKHIIKQILVKLVLSHSFPLLAAWGATRTTNTLSFLMWNYSVQRLSVQSQISIDKNAS